MDTHDFVYCTCAKLLNREPGPEVHLGPAWGWPARPAR